MPQNAYSPSAATSVRPTRAAAAALSSSPAARPPSPREIHSVPEQHEPESDPEDGAQSDPLDLLAELELFPAGRPAVTDSVAAGAPSWTEAEEVAAPVRRRTAPPAEDEDEREAPAAERRRQALSLLKLTPGQWQLETEPDEPRGAVRARHTSVGVGRVSRLDSLATSLQRRYRLVLDSLERDSRQAAEEGQPPLSLSPPAQTETEPRTPGREHLQFARTCLDQLSTCCTPDRADGGQGLL